VIVSFKDAGTQDVFDGRATRAARAACPLTIWRVARRKLDQLAAAGALSDLKVPPGNHLEALKGDRDGQFSIRINARYRVCFRWTGRDVQAVEIVDYH
jgi:proteic killer suppression protein